MSIGVVAMGLNFLALILLPLAEATAIGFSVPIFATLLAAMVLGEPTGRWRWGAVLVGFIGVLVIVQPGSGHIGGYGGLVALGAALSTACATIAIRHLGATEAAATTVFWFGASSLVPLGLAMLFVAQAARCRRPSRRSPASASPAGSPSWRSPARSGWRRSRWSCRWIIRRCSGRACSAGSLFDQLPSHWTWIGAPIVIAAGLVILWREQQPAASRERARSRARSQRMTWRLLVLRHLRAIGVDADRPAEEIGDQLGRGLGPPGASTSLR